jgi:hypothetical protein
VRKNKQLASKLIAVFAVAALAGTSAFAEDRHANETHTRGDAGRVATRGASRDDRAQQHAAPQRESFNRGEGTTNIDRQRTGSVARRTDNYRDNRSNNNYRDNNYRDNRSNNNYRDNHYRDNNYRNNHSDRNDRVVVGSYRNDSYRNRTPYFAHGRVTRIDRWNGGYRVYVGGAAFPFFVSDAFYRANHWRVGLSIQLGGFYNPLGYYDYYDGPYVGGATAYSDGDVRGVVESVDYRRGTFVVRNEASGSFVTVATRGRRDEVRPGDYVQMAGDWSRSGVFEAYRVDFLDDGDRR